MSLFIVVKQLTIGGQNYRTKETGREGTACANLPTFSHVFSQSTQCFTADQQVVCAELYINILIILITLTGILIYLFIFWDC